MTFIRQTFHMQKIKNITVLPHYTLHMYAYRYTGRAGLVCMYMHKYRYMYACMYIIFLCGDSYLSA